VPLLWCPRQSTDPCLSGNVGRTRVSIDFHLSGYAGPFFNSTLPGLVKAINRLAKALETSNPQEPKEPKDGDPPTNDREKRVIDTLWTTRNILFNSGNPENEGTVRTLNHILKLYGLT